MTVNKLHFGKIQYCIRCLVGSEDENFHKRYSIDLETPERRHTFAQRLRDALRREVSDSFTSSGESS